MFASLLLLAGCGDSAKERAAKFMPVCMNAHFSVEQCRFLFAMAEAQRQETEDDAATAITNQTALSSAVLR